MSLSPGLERNGVLDLPAVLDGSPDMACVRDMQGHFVRVNGHWEKSLGYPPIDLEGAALLPLIHPEDALATRARMKHADQAGDIVGFVNRYRRRDGGYLHLEWEARRIGNMVLGVARDVTERIAMECRARAAEKVRLNFFASISRETRRPLMDIIALAAALGRTRLTPAQHEVLQAIARSPETLDGLISLVLDESKVEAGRLELEIRTLNRPL
jgi:two-component system, sensor histidine kinase